jgi:hypothetical protein
VRTVAECDLGGERLRLAVMHVHWPVSSAAATRAGAMQALGPRTGQNCEQPQRLRPLSRRTAGRALATTSPASPEGQARLSEKVLANYDKSRQTKWQDKQDRDGHSYTHISCR